MAGGATILSLPQPLGHQQEENAHIEVLGRNRFIRYSNKADRKRPLKKGTRPWIEAKRERHLRKGKDVKRLSKYTGRRRH